MLDALTIDQLRTFIAAAEQGSFSAAGRKLKRAQSVVSVTLANLEAQLGVVLFERSGRYPQLTEQGRVLLQRARDVIDQMDALKAHARSMQDGLEPELSVVVDVMYPMDALTRAVGQSQTAFPHVPLLMYVEALGAVIKPVLDGTCQIGVIGSLPNLPDELTAEPLIPVSFVTVAAPDHPLCRRRSPLLQSEAGKHLQIILTDRTLLSGGMSFGVFSHRTWRLADLGAKHAFLRAGFGWGHMPKHLVDQDLKDGTLQAIRFKGVEDNSVRVLTQVVYRTDSPPGPAGRAFIAALKS